MPAKRTKGKGGDGQNAREGKRRFGLSAEAARCLALQAACTDSTPAAVLEHLVLTHCRDFVVYPRKRGPAATGEGEAGTPGAAA